MDLRLSSLVLAACLFLGSSAPTPEECESLVKPKQMTSASEFHGKAHVIMGYSDNKFLKTVLKLYQSSWMNLTQGPAGPEDLAMVQRNRINGSCVFSKATITLHIEDNVAHMEMGNITTKSHSLPACEECMVSSINYTFTNFQASLQKLGMNIEGDTHDVTHAHAIYLMAKETSVKDLDIQKFKQQAACMGYTGEPDYQSSSEHALCQEGEGTEMKWSK